MQASIDIRMDDTRTCTSSRIGDSTTAGTINDSVSVVLVVGSKGIVAAGVWMRNTTLMSMSMSISSEEVVVVVVNGINQHMIIGGMMMMMLRMIVVVVIVITIMGILQLVSFSGLLSTSSFYRLYSRRASRGRLVAASGWHTVCPTNKLAILATCYWFVSFACLLDGSFALGTDRLDWIGLDWIGLDWIGGCQREEIPEIRRSGWMDVM
jgi:hypothetical protein